MHQFLKLKCVVINMNHVSKITTLNNKHYIYMNQVLAGAFFGIGGGIASSPDYIEVCEKIHYDDYKTVSDWINNIK